MLHDGTIRHAEVRQHCPHETGAGSGHESAKGMYLICCQCGAQGIREYVKIVEQLKDHGPHFKNTRWQVVGMSWKDDVGSCSA